MGYHLARTQPDPAVVQSQRERAIAAHPGVSPELARFFAG